MRDICEKNNVKNLAGGFSLNTKKLANSGLSWGERRGILMLYAVAMGRLSLKEENYERIGY